MTTQPTSSSKYHCFVIFFSNSTKINFTKKCTGLNRKTLGKKSFTNYTSYSIIFHHVWYSATTTDKRQRKLTSFVIFEIRGRAQQRGIWIYKFRIYIRVPVTAKLKAKNNISASAIKSSELNENIVYNEKNNLCLFFATANKEKCF